MFTFGFTWIPEPTPLASSDTVRRQIYFEKRPKEVAKKTEVNGSVSGTLLFEYETRSIKWPFSKICTNETLRNAFKCPGLFKNSVEHTN